LNHGPRTTDIEEIMAEEKPSLHIDTDWKRQAQEEKKKLAEQERAAAAAAPAGGAGVEAAGGAGSAGGAGPAAGRAGAGASARGAREMPPPTFGSLVQSIVTQVLYYLGDLASRGGQPMLDLDMAKHHVDTLAMLEQKTQGNLDEAEKKMLDAALYETRMRYVSVASQFLGP
jgi:hypothetical protein